MAAVISSPKTPIFELDGGFSHPGAASTTSTPTHHIIRPKLNRIEEIFTGGASSAGGMYSYTPHSSPNPSMLVHHSPAMSHTFSPAMAARSTPMILHSPVMAKLQAQQSPQHRANGTPMILHTPVLAAVGRSPSLATSAFPGSPIGFAEYFSRSSGPRKSLSGRGAAMTRSRAMIQSPYIWPPYVHGQNANGSESESDSDGSEDVEMDGVGAAVLKGSVGEEQVDTTQGDEAHVVGAKPSPIKTTTTPVRVHFNDVIEEVPNSPQSPRSAGESGRGRSKVRGGGRGSSAIRSQRPGLRRTRDYHGRGARISGLGVSSFDDELD